MPYHVLIQRSVKLRAIWYKAEVDIKNLLSFLIEEHTMRKQKKPFRVISKQLTA